MLLQKNQWKRNLDIFLLKEEFMESDSYIKCLDVQIKKDKDGQMNKILDGDCKVEKYILVSNKYLT